jgi:hypothetical protein
LSIGHQLPSLLSARVFFPSSLPSVSLLSSSVIVLRYSFTVNFIYLFIYWRFWRLRSAAQAAKSDGNGE